MPPVAIFENKRNQWKNTLACAVSLAFSTFSSRMMSRIQVCRLVHSGQFSLTTRGPETTPDSVWRGREVNSREPVKASRRQKLFIVKMLLRVGARLRTAMYSQNQLKSVRLRDSP